MIEISHEIHTLNGLIAHTIDSIDGYAAAAEEPRTGRLGDMFRARADERRTVVRNLQAEVVRLGGDPEENGTLLARAHRTWLKLKTVVAGDDARAIINEVERGEDRLEARFESALADESLPLSAKLVIRTAFGLVRDGHEQMRDLKHLLAVPA